jgi:hypothetical protein
MQHWFFKSFRTAGPGVLAGLVYGVLLQIAGRASVGGSEARILMTVGFVFFLPLAMGALTLLLAPADARERWAYRILMPWLTTSLSMAVAYIWQWEGSICLILGLPVYLTLASIGGILTGIVLSRTSDNRMRAAFGVFLMALPPVLGRAELTQPLTAEQIETRTSIDIEADAKTVWKNIIRVPAITEEQNGFFYKIGFPKPVEATLSAEGIGGVRHASFERGLVFVETVHEWQPERVIAFHIEVDPNATPVTTLDPHVTVGGDYFDVLNGKYEIEPLDINRMRLHLKSQHRLSTRFNWYAALWSSFLMRDIQNSILGVIKERCERSAASASGITGL